MEQIERATDIDFVRFYKHEPPKEWIGYAVKKGKLVKSMAGVAKLEDGSFFGFLNITDKYRKPILFRQVLRALLLAARELNATTVKTTCDLDIPHAEFFLRRLGFLPTDDEINNQKVWVCQALKQ